MTHQHRAAGVVILPIELTYVSILTAANPCSLVASQEAVRWPNAGGAFRMCPHQNTFRERTTRAEVTGALSSVQLGLDSAWFFDRGKLVT